MSQSRILASLAAAVFGIAVLGACSAESLSERAVELGLEQAVEGDEDIDVDFDGDGGFTVSTDEGEFTVNVDGDNGGIVFDSEDGSGVINFDEDGIVFDSEDGSGVINFDENGATFDSEDGGSAVFGSKQVPDSWPSAIGVPQTMDPETSFFSQVENGDGGTNLTGIFQHSTTEPYAAHVEAVLIADGWSLVFESGNDDGRYVNFEKEGAAAVVVADDTGFTSVSITNY